MPTPFVTNFGDENHEEGETGLVVTGFDFGLPDGEVWMFANADRSGLSDQLTVGSWGETSITGIAIPGTPNNSTGTVYLAVMTADFQWSSPAFPYPFTLSASGGGPTFSVKLHKRFMLGNTGMGRGIG